MYRRILVPVDDSVLARRALNEACRLVQNQEAVMKVVHIVDMAQMAWGGTEFLDVAEWQTSMKEAGEKLLGDIKTYLGDKHVDAEISLVEGCGLSVGDEILSIAQEWYADLIIMGTHGRSGLMHVLMGSVAEAVLHKTVVPMLLVRTHDSDSAEEKTFLDG